MNRDSKFRQIVAGGLAVALAASTVACKKSASTEPGATGTSAPKAAAAVATSAAPGGESPQAVVDRMRKAGESKNFPEAVACLSPNARKDMATALYLGATMMVAFSQMGSQMGGAMMEGVAGMAEGMGGNVSEADKAKAKEEMEKSQKELAALSEKYNAVMQKHGLPVLPKEGEAPPAELSKEEMDKKFAALDHSAFVAETMALLDSMPGEHKSDSGPFQMPAGNLENLKIEGDKASASLGGEAMNFVQVDGRWFLDVDMMGGAGGPGGPGGEAPPAAN